MARQPIAALYADEKDGQVVWTVDDGSERTVDGAAAVELAGTIDAATGGTGARMAVRTVQRAALNARMEALAAEQADLEAAIVDLEMEADPTSVQSPASAPVPITQARRARASKAAAPATTKAAAEPEPAVTVPDPAPAQVAHEDVPVDLPSATDETADDEPDDATPDETAPPADDDDVPVAEPPAEEDEF